ncbi:hypothetical protein Syun_027546 [Stephania yunnanensis]|uniref:Uncharacterized protein n=1 Tax=Stephania yunnanensis TaxID=152371 RepID=A0AAP0EFS8_9MAGN
MEELGERALEDFTKVLMEEGLVLSLILMRKLLVYQDLKGLRLCGKGYGRFRVGHGIPVLRASLWYVRGADYSWDGAWALTGLGADGRLYGLCSSGQIGGFMDYAVLGSLEEILVLNLVDMCG